MPEIEDLRNSWKEYDRKLDLNIRLSRQLLLAASLNKVRSPMRRLAFFLACEAALGLAVTFYLGPFIYAHIAEPRFALPAIALHIWVIAFIAASIRQMVLALQIDYEKPIAAIQKQIESLRIFRIRYIQWSLLTGQLIWWIPFLVVAFKGFFGLDAWHLFSTPYIAANLLFGLAVIPFAIGLSKKFGPRLDRSPFLQRLTRSLSGYNLNAASSFLSTLSAFERE